nr:MAG TPA: hypothetical protein [Caudoviricetes sp.]
MLKKCSAPHPNYHNSYGSFNPHATFLLHFVN